LSFGVNHRKYLATNIQGYFEEFCNEKSIVKEGFLEGVSKVKNTGLSFPRKWESILYYWFWE